MKYLVCFFHDHHYNPPLFRIAILQVLRITIDDGYIFGKVLLNINDAIIDDFAPEKDPYLFSTLSLAQQTILQWIFE